MGGEFEATVLAVIAIPIMAVLLFLIARRRARIGAASVLGFAVVVAVSCMYYDRTLSLSGFLLYFAVGAIVGSIVVAGVVLVLRVKRGSA